MSNEDKKVAINVRDVPEDLRNRFKAVCANEGTSMQDAIQMLLRFAVQHNLNFRQMGQSV